MDDKGTLVLSRKEGETILIGDDIKITLYELKSRKQARIMIECPKSIKIIRGELADKKEENYNV